MKAACSRLGRSVNCYRLWGRTAPSPVIHRYNNIPAFSKAPLLYKYNAIQSHDEKKLLRPSENIENREQCSSYRISTINRGGWQRFVRICPTTESNDSCDGREVDGVKHSLFVEANELLATRTYNYYRKHLLQNIPCLPWLLKKQHRIPWDSTWWKLVKMISTSFTRLNGPRGLLTEYKTSKERMHLEWKAQQQLKTIDLKLPPEVTVEKRCSFKWNTTSVCMRKVWADQKRRSRSSYR